MTTFYLVRHGETVWNKEHRLQGWLDSPLSENGILHAKKLGEQLKNIPFTAAYSSTSGRAKETLHYLTAGRKLAIHYEDDLREIFLGHWQGKTVENIMAINRFDYELYTNYPAQFVATHTESFGEVTERAMYTLKNIAQRYPHEHILIVSHGVTIKCIINAILERGIDQLWTAPHIEGTSMTIVERTEESWYVKVIGSTQHLQ
ncbi:phosphoglycerate mutase [Lysinibacillus sphaericus]|uniref:histidine phosphatase family protein n=1 Tax=Lysinibacillus TaxID=400634 RepID=UPI00084AB0CD|nr:histidine phosphatase family protein [Lysinibacillus sphaericus]OEC00791.1 phosphoglycerate mutase [Lysinibacillus sphaericus]